MRWRTHARLCRRSNRQVVRRRHNEWQADPGLFPIRASGVSTEPVRKAAEAFLAGLTQAQCDKTMFPVGDAEWQLWANQRYYARQGVGFDEMDMSYPST